MRRQPVLTGAHQRGFESLSTSEHQMNFPRSLISVSRSVLLILPVTFVAWGQAQKPVVAGSLLPSPASQPTEYRNTEQTGYERIFGIVPSHNTLPDRSMAAPLRTREKFRLAGADSFDQATFVLAGFYAGVGQWQHQYPQFGLGATGFAKRYATAYADQVLGNYMIEAIFPTMLHQDPRYYRMSHGGFIQSTTYAVSRILITRSDSEAERFNFSQVGGLPPRQLSRIFTIRRGPSQARFRDLAFNSLVAASSTS
jgi:hypothetical protein